MHQLQKDKLIQTSRVVVRLGIIVNRILLIAVSLAFLLSWILAAQLNALLVSQDPGVDARAEATGLRLMMLVGVVMAIAVDRLFVALAKIIESARAGDPFIAMNARRLRHIGWALMVLQLLDIPAALIERNYPGLGSGSLDAPFSAGGWLAVIMVFVLSRVFAVGSAMRDELEGTV